MKVKKISLALASVIAWLSLSVGLALPAMAQTTQQDINNGLCAGSNIDFTSTPGQCAASGVAATSQINNIVHTIVNLLSVIVGLVAVIMIMFGGFRYVTSGGNDTSVTNAKNTILYAIIGLVVVAMAQLIVHFTLSKLANS